MHSHTPTHNLWFWPKRPPLAFSVAETSVAEMSGPKRPRPKCPWPKCPTLPESVCSTEKVLKKLQLSRPYCKSFADIGPHAVFIEFCKIYGNFCKVFAAYKQVRDSTDFLYQTAGILLLLSTTMIFWYLSKVSVILTVSKT